MQRLATAAGALAPEAAPEVESLAVTAVEWSEPPVLEQRPQPPLAVEEAIAVMAGFFHADCAAEVEMSWPLWQFGREGWRRQPARLVCTTLGPGFAAGAAADEGQVQVDFGMDELYLAELAPWDRATRMHLQTNIAQLLAGSLQLQHRLQPRRRRLWSEGGGDWSERLAERLRQAAAAPGEGPA